MLANTHSTPSATVMLTSWPVMRTALAFEALASTKRPSAIRAIRKASSTPSRWRVKYSLTRRMTRLFILLLRRLGLLRRRHLAEQVVVDDLARDRRGVARAETRVLHYHRQRDPRLVGRRVGDEQGVVAKALGHLALDVL